MTVTAHSSPSERLQAARIQAGFLTASQAARSFGWNENTYRSHENGERGLKQSTAQKYAKAFKTTVTKILFGVEEEEVLTLIPIIGTVGSDGIVTMTGNRHNYTNDAMLMFQGVYDSYALEISDSARFVPFRSGDLLLIWDVSLRGTAFDGGYALVGLPDGQLLVRMVRAGERPNTVHLEMPFIATESNATTDGLSPVRAIIPSGQWKKVARQPS